MLYLHIISGGDLCYILIPKAELWIMVLFIAGFSALREHIQSLRKHAQQSYHKYTDTLGWVIGALIYYYLRENHGLDADQK